MIPVLWAVVLSISNPALAQSAIESGMSVPGWAPSPAPMRIRIVYPPDRMNIPPIERMFVFGSVDPPYARLSVNGQDTQIMRSASGGWLALVPVRAGKFSIVARAILDNGVEVADTRWVIGAKGAGPPPSRPAVSEKKLMENLASEAVHKPQRERDLKPWRIARVSDETGYLRSGPNVVDEQAGYEIRLQKNVLLTLSGQVGKTYRVRLSEWESVWVDEFAVNLLPKQTPSPESFVSTWTIRRGVKSTTMHTNMQELLPYRATVADDGRSLSLRIYGGVSNTDWIHYASDDPWVKHASWSHPMEGVYQLDVSFRQPLWGYDVRYEKKKLVMEFRDAPSVAISTGPVTWRREKETGLDLRGVKVAVDPGHPPQGTIGPMGIPENVVNWQIAVKLCDALTRAGATAILTRAEGETVPLPDRVVRARNADADLFVSIHANALSPDGNPFEQNGLSVYYYQSFSQPLAEAVHKTLRSQIPLRDDGLHYGNLHVIRQPFMPAILVECGYLIWPPDEEFLLSPESQTRLATALEAGIETFLRQRCVSR